MVQFFTSTVTSASQVQFRTVQLLFNLKQLLFIFLLLTTVGLTGQTYTFTNAGAAGAMGPSQAQVTTAYTATSLDGLVTVTGNGIQRWVVPVSGLYVIEATGASGGDADTAGNFGGLGAQMRGEFILQMGDTILVLVGQEGTDGVQTGSGGGGTFVVQNGTLLVAAGGGGGGANANNGADGTTSTSGTNDHQNGTISGGTNGDGGSACNISGANHGGGGGGYIGNGATSTLNSPGDGGFSFLNGGAGGLEAAPGGFGGGGGSGHLNFGGAGGGGGYSGGTGGQQVNHCTPGIGRSGGGGGGSLNIGTNQVNQGGIQVGDGVAVFTILSTGAMNDAGVVAIDSPAVVCEGTHNVVATIMNYGANQIDNVTVHWMVDGLPQNPVTYNGLLDTFGGAGIVTDQVLLGSNTFAGGTYAIKAWTSMPNGMADTVNQNDTLEVNKLAHPNPVVDLGGDTVFCAGTTPFLILNASQPGASYQWSTGSQGSSVIITQPGIYSVIVTSQAGCHGYDTMEVKTAPSPVVAINDTIVCEGTTVVLDAGNPGSTYLWSDNSNGQTLTVSTTGLYQVTVTNQDGCSADDIAVVTVNPNPVVDLGSDTATHIWADVTLDAGNPGATYLWSTGATTRTITVNVHGTYSVTVTDANGCEGTDAITITGTGIHTIEGLGKWSVFPNPATDATHIRLELVRGGKITLELYDPSGRRVWEQAHPNATGTETYSIPMHHLAQGMYLLRVQLDGQLIGTSGVGKM